MSKIFPASESGVNSIWQWSYNSSSWKIAIFFPRQLFMSCQQWQPTEGLEHQAWKRYYSPSRPIVHWGFSAKYYGVATMAKPGSGSRELLSRFWKCPNHPQNLNARSDGARCTNIALSHLAMMRVDIIALGVWYSCVTLLPYSSGGRKLTPAAAGEGRDLVLSTVLPLLLSVPSGIPFPIPAYAWPAETGRGGTRGRRGSEKGKGGRKEGGEEIGIKGWERKDWSERDGRLWRFSGFRFLPLSWAMGAMGDTLKEWILSLTTARVTA